MADENNSNEDGQFVPDGSMEPLSPQEADNTDYGLMVGERVQKKDLQQEMRESYLAYAMSVIVDRALPDVRDGMKPVHRRVIYAMYDGGYRPDRGYSKCARVVGEVMGKYHPHGDSAIYDTLVRMAQSWSMRYTLVDGQGNFGSPGDDPAAAMRYTECRMAPLADRAAGPLPEPAVQRLVRHRRRHGDQHSSAQHARGGRRRALGARPSGREP